MSRCCCRTRWAVGWLFAAAPASFALAQPLAVTLKNQVNLGTTTTDQNVQPVTIAGLSGLTYLSANRWVAVMDNSDVLIDLSIALAADGSISSASITSAIRLSQVRDQEDIAYTGPVRNTVLVCEEDTPQVHEYSLSPATLGQLVQSLPTPPVFLNRRANFGFESLSRRANGAELWTCNEEALTVDGPVSTPSAGTTVRLQRYTLAGSVATPSAEYAYLTQPIHAPNTSGARSGVSALVSLPSGRLLALERSFGFDIFAPFQTRIYDVSVAGATDISALPGFIGQSYTRAAKTLLYSGSLTNLEGLALGPALPGGSYAILGIVDDGDPISVNRLVAFVLTGPVAAPPCPADADGNGLIQPADIAAFVNLWSASLSAGTTAGDFDGNGSVTPADVAAFVSAWFTSLAAGC